MKQIILIYMLINTLFVLMACNDKETVSSATVTTDNIFVDAHFNARGSEMGVRVQLLEGGLISNTQVELLDGDHLWLSKGDGNITDVNIDGDLFLNLPVSADQHIKLEKEGGDADGLFGFITGMIFIFDIFTSNDITYFAKVSDYEDGTLYRLSLLRDKRIDALDSTVVIPSGFSITAPLANETHSRSNDLQINWSPSGTSAMVEIRSRSECNGNTSNTYTASVASDSGSFTIPAGALTGVVGACVTTYEVTKNQQGTIDSNISSGGRIIGHQVRSVSLTTFD